MDIGERDAVATDGTTPASAPMAEKRPEVGDTLLHAAARAGRRDQCRSLARRYPDWLSVRNTDGDTPLLLAVRKQDDVMARDLARLGGQVNVVDVRGDTPLHIAAASGSILMCQELIDMGADMKVQDKEGRTPLMRGMANRHFIVMDVLQDAMEKRRKREARPEDEDAEEIGGGGSSVGGAQPHGKAGSAVDGAGRKTAAEAHASNQAQPMQTSGGGAGDGPGQPGRWREEQEVPLPLEAVVDHGISLARLLLHLHQFGDCGGLKSEKFSCYGASMVRTDSNQLAFLAPECMPPEVYAGGRATHATDIFTVGVVLCYMFTGRVPPALSQPRSAPSYHCGFQHATRQKMPEEAVQEGKCSLQLPGGIPEGLLGIIRGCCCDQAQFRCTARDLLMQLQCLQPPQSAAALEKGSSAAAT